jgi:hypothetical protein
MNGIFCFLLKFHLPGVYLIPCAQLLVAWHLSFLDFGFQMLGHLVFISLARLAIGVYSVHPLACGRLALLNLLTHQRNLAKRH